MLNWAFHGYIFCYLPDHFEQAELQNSIGDWQDAGLDHRTAELVLGGLGHR